MCHSIQVCASFRAMRHVSMPVGSSQRIRPFSYNRLICIYSTCNSDVILEVTAFLKLLMFLEVSFQRANDSYINHQDQKCSKFVQGDRECILINFLLIRILINYIRITELHVLHIHTSQI